MKRINLPGFLRPLKQVNSLDVICVLFAVLFIYAAVSKILTFDEFNAQIAKSPLTMGHEEWIAWTVPTFEIIVALLLFVPRFQLLALYGAFSIMFVFTAYIGLMLAFTPELPCSCGGILSAMGWEEHFIFNVGFTLLGVIGIVLFNKQRRYTTQSIVA